MINDQMKLSTIDMAGKVGYKADAGKMMQDLLHELQQIGSGRTASNDEKMEAFDFQAAIFEPAMINPIEKTVEKTEPVKKNNPLTSRLMTKIPDPTDIDYAIERMFGLLAEDGDKGARRLMPSRGGYLNIIL